MAKQTVRDIDVAGKRVLCRVDFNVPLDKSNGVIADDRRIRAALPTIQYLRAKGARVVLCSHFGRPDGRIVESMRLAPVAERLAELLAAPVAYVQDCVGPEVEAAVAALDPGGVLLLENTRFHPEEEANDPKFAAQLAALADVYVNDAFGSAHRAHASTEGVAHDLPAVAGFLMEAELSMLDRCLRHPERPFVAIVGGAKISSKIDVLDALIVRADRIIVGGGMACTFLAAQGIDVGSSLVEPSEFGTARRQMAAVETAGKQLLLPTDAVVAQRIAADAPTRLTTVSEIGAGWSMLDIGPDTVARYEAAIADARTVLWNGPMGVFEFAPFAAGTLAVARAVAASAAVSVVGGGETAEAVEEAGVTDRITHVSTGGGATLEYIEGRTLPGVAALADAT